MLTTGFLLILLAAGACSIECPPGQLRCGSLACYDPSIQGCSSTGSIIQCINSCNGTCYSSSQYCYNNTKVCNTGESVCDVKSYSYFLSVPLGLTCYNASMYQCANGTLCSGDYACGSQCLPNSNTVCANNQTVCEGFNYWNYYYYSARSLRVCGPRQICYDNSTSVCLNGSTVCPSLNARLCGANCYNPDNQNCTNGAVRCINSCNGTCYSNNQTCFNSTKVCNRGESVCDVKTYGYFSTASGFGLTCYNTSQQKCANSTLCLLSYSCGSHCLTDYNATCVNNQTLCVGFDFWRYYYSNQALKLCGPRQTCYDNTTSVCLNGTTVCPGLNARLCGSSCFNPDTQTCTSGVVRCINSCNGTCYSSSQYCHNNTKVCNSGESVCHVREYGFMSAVPPGVHCYNASEFKCANNTLCFLQYSCGSHCLTDNMATCVNNQTLCPGFNYWTYTYGSSAVKLCGSRQTCYDNSTSMCFEYNSTVCPIGSQLCDGVCYNPQSQYCIGGNNSVYCLANPSSVDCTTPTPPPPMSNGSCCAVKNCVQHSDCCQADASECQCFRHNQMDMYGSCVNPNVTPVCGNSCPVRGRCQADSDCCKCQCAEVTFTDVTGMLTTTKQCIRR